MVQAYRMEGHIRLFVFMSAKTSRKWCTMFHKNNFCVCVLRVGWGDTHAEYVWCACFLFRLQNHCCSCSSTLFFGAQSTSKLSFFSLICHLQIAATQLLADSALKAWLFLHNLFSFLSSSSTLYTSGQSLPWFPCINASPSISLSYTFRWNVW